MFCIVNTVVIRTCQSSLVSLRALSIILYGKYCYHKNLLIFTGEFEGIVAIILYGKYCYYKNLPIFTGEFEGIVYYSV